jgi:porin
LQALSGTVQDLPVPGSAPPTRDRRRGAAVRAAVLLLMLGSAPPAQAYDVTDWLSVEGVLAVSGQCQLVSGDTANDSCRSAAPLQTEVSWHPNQTDEVFVKLGAALGDGLNDTSPFALSPWAADLREDVEDINGRYDYLLNAWYAHRFELPRGISLRVTGGIIDATDYLDENAYSNDEYTQFMNAALVNGPQGFAPSYDVGGALELDVGPWSARGVVMDIGENDGGNGFVFWGTQLGYRAETRWGEGNYRVFVLGSSRDFPDPAGAGLERLRALGLSVDQQLGEILGAWMRLAWQDDEASISFEAIYSGGVNIRGGAWARPDDEIGLGYGYLPGGNGDLRSTHVGEAYYRLAINEYFALTLDAQYMKDSVRSDQNPGGWILGLRGTFEF